MPAILEQLLTDIRRCTVCRDLPLGPKPLLQGSATAKILIAGQAPGRRTHEAGIPFEDASGRRLRDWLGVDDATFYDPQKIAILPMGFCYPGRGNGGDLPPRPECAATWRERLLGQLPNVKLTVLIGLHAQRWHLRERCARTLTANVVDWREFWPAVLPLPHPSPRNANWIMRNPFVEDELLPALRERVGELVR